MRLQPPLKHVQWRAALYTTGGSQDAPPDSVVGWGGGNPFSVFGSATQPSPPSRALWIRACLQLPIFWSKNAPERRILHYKYNFFRVSDPQTPAAKGETLPHKVLCHSAQSWCPSASFRLATALAVGWCELLILILILIGLLILY